MKLAELYQFYTENQIAIDEVLEARNVTWNNLPYERMLAIYHAMTEKRPARKAGMPKANAPKWDALPIITHGNGLHIFAAPKRPKGAEKARLVKGMRRELKRLRGNPKTLCGKTIFSPEELMLRASQIKQCLRRQESRV